jgi:hypothetical protein
MDSRLRDTLDLQDKLAAQRRFYEPMWQEIAERVMPDAAIFTTKPAAGSKRTSKMFDATAALALPRYAAAMESMLTPRTSRWHGIRQRNDQLNEIPEVQEYNDQRTDLLFSVRYSPIANFASQAHECYLSNGAYGTASLFIDDMLGQGIRYRAIHLAEMYFAENFAGIIDIAHRKFKYSARQAKQAFGDKLPGSIMRAAEKDPLQEFTFLHCVRPNELHNPRGYGQNSKKFESYYICVDEPAVVREGFGYRTFPYAISRNLTMPGEVYARGVASLVLPDIKQLNEFEKTILRQGHLAVDPPILLQEDGALSGFNMQPGALVWGGVNADGEPMAKPFQTGANLAVGFDMLEAKRKVINDAFLVTLFQILVDAPQMTATEAMLRAQEKGQLLAPTMGRQQSEFLGPLIARELEILEAAGVMPPPPPVLQKYGDLYDVEYVSPLNRAQMAEEGIAISRTLEMAASMAQFDPSITRMVKGQDALREVAKINGMKAKFLKTADEMAEEDQQAQEMQMAQNALAAAPAAAASAKDFAQAQAIASASPAQVAPVTLPTAR